MKTLQSGFGRRSQPHQIILSRGEKVRSVSIPAWGVWSLAALCIFSLAWLVGSTVYLAFQDDIDEAAKTHRISVERAYEDKIASLRRRIDEINTRQFLDQQVFEDKLTGLLRRQSELEERHQEIASLFDGARERKLTINLDPDPTGDVAQQGKGGFGLITTVAHAAGFDPSRPAPLDGSRASAVRDPDAGKPTIDRIEASIDRVESMQGNMLSALQTTVDGLSEQLVEVSAAVGAELPDGAAEDGVGGPLIELRRIDGAPAPDLVVDRIRDSFERYDVLRAYVSRLPVRVPLEGTIKTTSGFGTRLDPFLKRPALHTGLDFRASAGAPVHASAGGLVTVAGFSGGYGRLVEIDHGNGYRTRYGHLSRILVEPGATVAAGDVVGLVGSSGRSTGPHLHYETRVSGMAKDPTPFIQAAQLLPAGY